VAPGGARDPERRVMPRRVTIVGAYLSPYVRKVLVCLDLKGIEYEIDPIVPFFGGERFSELSPIRRIPVWIDDRVTLCDSTVICEYLDDRWPDPALRPADVAERARARWLEEFADTRLGEVLVWGLFNQKVINPFVWGVPTDEAVVAKLLEQDVPQVLDWLETQLPAESFCFGALSLADVALACFFRNAAFARFRPDASRWPRTAGFVERVLALPSFAKLAPFEQCMLRTPIPRQRAALAELGAPLTAETLGTDAPRRGVMRS
jgi:glutathione S-transferase